MSMPSDSEEISINDEIEKRIPGLVEFSTDAIKDAAARAGVKWTPDIDFIVRAVLLSSYEYTNAATKFYSNETSKE